MGTAFDVHLTPLVRPHSREWFKFSDCGEFGAEFFRQVYEMSEGPPVVTFPGGLTFIDRRSPLWFWSD